MKNIIKPSLSTILVSCFFFILVGIALVTEMFEAQTPEINFAQIYSNPLPTTNFSKIKKIQLSNKNGTFVFENTHPEFLLEGPWQMTAPQNLKAKSPIFVKMSEALKGIRVRNFHRLEPININSFSLNNPTLTLSIFTPKKSFTLNMGLINPIDNSAYISISKQDQIYQIDPLEISLESYDLPQLVESKVLALNFDSLSAMEIYVKNNLLFKIFKKDNSWIDQNGSILSENKVKDFMEKIESIKSSSILENLTSEQKEFLNKLLSSSLYTLKIISNLGVRNYFFGELKEGPENTGLPKEALGSFIMSSEDRDSFVIINNQELNFISSGLKGLK
jgi:hypothetical protein